jgi:pSer/pThr/pTyr-binding forkhead associated (FHA) protein
MRLTFPKPDGTVMVLKLGDQPITIGRGHEADVIIHDEKVSRIHCGIRLWDGSYFLKDLKSRNGTLCNGEPVDVVKLNPGDRISVGSVVFAFESDQRPGTETIFRQTEEEIIAGKGYSTILREIVNDMGQPLPPPVQKPKTERFKKPGAGK